jgi:hypothetical protein
MPGKREGNWRDVRRERAAIRKRALRSRCAGGNVLAVAERLAWSGSVAKENVDLLASEGKKLLEKIKNDSATCACAFCGMIIFGDSKMRHARDVAEVFSSTARWPRYSARGVAASNFIAPVIRDLVSKGGQLFSCGTCEGICQACAKAGEGKELEEQDPVATERSKRQRARSMLNIASSGAPENGVHVWQSWNATQQRC